MTPQAVLGPRTYGKPWFDHGVHNSISWHVTGDEEYRKTTPAFHGELKWGKLDRGRIFARHAEVF